MRRDGTIDYLSPFVLNEQMRNLCQILDSLLIGLVSSDNQSGTSNDMLGKTTNVPWGYSNCNPYPLSIADVTCTLHTPRSDQS